LGQIYYQGKIVPKDLAEAWAWYRLAARQHEPVYQKASDQAEAETSAADRHTADLRFNELLQKANQTKMMYDGAKSYREKEMW
jgi:hypothetical protein